MIIFVSIVKQIYFTYFQKSVALSHPMMHDILGQDVTKYLEHDPNIKVFFQRLLDAKKKLFLVTNSPYKFV